MSKADSQISSSIEPEIASRHNLPGDPACPICHGIGYLRADLPIDHPDFGKLKICKCREEQIHQQTRRRLFKLSNLDELSHLTFENFRSRGHMGLSPLLANTLELAYNQSQQFAQSLNGWLLLQGDYGCGKTHLAAAIANFAVEMGVSTLFITVPDLLDSLRFAYQSPEYTFEERFEEIRKADLLILDDFGTQSATQWAQEKIFQIINYRYINRLPLVVTTNLTLQDIDERVRSRLMDPELVTRVRILAPDYRNPTGDYGHHLLSSLEDHSKLTFATFETSQRKNLKPEDIRNLERAFEIAREFAENPRGWLVFIGDPFTGKTHLAAAIAHFYADTQRPPMFVGVTDLMDHLRATFNPNSTVSLDRLFEEVRTAPLLILDNFETETASPWAREKLYQLINYRFIAELPTVFTTSKELEQIDPRLRSRFMDRRICRIFAITAPSYTGM